MSSQSDYTAEEWAALVRAPMLAGMALTLADPGGPIEAAKEAVATIKVLTAPAGQEELLGAVSQSVNVLMDERKNPIGDFDLDPGNAGQQILDELKRVDGILQAKAAPEEATAFRTWLTMAAQAAADAAKEGGFLGFGAVRVSEGEQSMLDQVSAALGGGAGTMPDTDKASGAATGEATAVKAETGAQDRGAAIPRVDPDLCTGCGICEDICPDVFEIGDDGLSHVIDEDACEDATCCEEAAEECPEGAITIE